MPEPMPTSPVSSTLVTSRDHLHQIAFFAVSPARQAAVGRMGLRPAPGGFGTPPFDGRVARVEGDLLVHEQGADIATRSITTVREAAAFFGQEYREVWYEGFRDPLEPIDPDTPLLVDEADARFIGEWFRFAFGVLDELRSAAGPGEDASEPQIWPEHFDAAIELGDAETGTRASFGLSPGDGPHPAPYVYVAPWGDFDTDDEYWNASGFGGSSLGYEELLRAGEPGSVALEFLLEGRRRLQRPT